MNRTTSILIALGISATLCASVSRANDGQQTNNPRQGRTTAFRARHRSALGGEQLQGAIIIGPVVWWGEADAGKKSKPVIAEIREITADSVSMDSTSGKAEFTGHVLVDMSRHEIRAAKAVVPMDAESSDSRVIRLTGDVRVLDRRTGDVQTFHELELSSGEED